MSEATVRTIKGTKRREKITLPEVFNAPFRPDLIHRAVLSDESKRKQPQGRYYYAGRLVAASSVGPGRGISKVPRTHGRGTAHGYKGAFINSVRGGKLAHPPRVEKKIVEKINKKEYAIALKSAVSATSSKETVKERGHKFDDKTPFPIVVEDQIMEIKKTKDFSDVLKNLGLTDDLTRAENKKIRSGKGKMRGRRYKQPKGPLVVVGEHCDAVQAAKNLPGVDIVTVSHLSVELLAPGAAPGRATVWTESALKELENWK